jgi:ubiquinone/menaquinone biosynthesis C-methylase UbiE
MANMPTTAWIYDLLMKPLGWLGLARLRGRLVRDVRGRTLEIGAGTGLNLALYDPGASPLVALDVDHDGLLRGRQRRPQAFFVQASVEALPFRDEAFDSIVSCLVFCSVPHPAAGLAEVRRVLRADGQLAMLEHVRPPGRVLGWLADRLTPLWRRLTTGCHLNRRTTETLDHAGLPSTRGRAFLRGTVIELKSRRASTVG